MNADIQGLWLRMWVSSVNNLPKFVRNSYIFAFWWMQDMRFRTKRKTFLGL